MHCSDLERYLEACLDGQLGESRRHALKEHLTVCRTCRERVDSLRRFEADLQRRLRAMQHEASLWQPLGLEVVADRPLSDAPPRPTILRKPLPRRGIAGPGASRHALRPGRAVASPPVQRRWLQNMAGGALLLAAFAALAELALGGLDRLGGGARPDVYRAYLDGAVELDLRTREPARLASWLGEGLGRPVSLPAMPESFELVGGSRGETGLPEGAAVAIYATSDGAAMLLIEPADEAGEQPSVFAPLLDADSGLNRLAWREGGHAYSLISALPPEKLALFPAP